MINIIIGWMKWEREEKDFELNFFGFGVMVVIWREQFSTKRFPSSNFQLSDSKQGEQLQPVMQPSFFFNLSLDVLFSFISADKLYF